MKWIVHYSSPKLSNASCPLEYQICDLFHCWQWQTSMIFRTKVPRNFRILSFHTTIPIHSTVFWLSRFWSKALQQYDSAMATNFEIPWRFHSKIHISIWILQRSIICCSKFQGTWIIGWLWRRVRERVRSEMKLNMLIFEGTKFSNESYKIHVRTLFFHVLAQIWPLMIPLPIQNVFVSTIFFSFEKNKSMWSTNIRANISKKLKTTFSHNFEVFKNMQSLGRNQ